MDVALHWKNSKIINPSWHSRGVCQESRGVLPPSLASLKIEDIAFPTEADWETFSWCHYSVGESASSCFGSNDLKIFSRSKNVE